jgi:hypothetical protein
VAQKIALIMEQTFEIPMRRCLARRRVTAACLVTDEKEWMNSQTKET